MKPKPLPIPILLEIQGKEKNVQNELIESISGGLRHLAETIPNFVEIPDELGHSNTFLIGIKKDYAACTELPTFALHHSLAQCDRKVKELWGKYFYWPLYMYTEQRWGLTEEILIGRSIRRFMKPYKNQKKIFGTAVPKDPLSQYYLIRNFVGDTTFDRQTKKDRIYRKHCITLLGLYERHLKIYDPFRESRLYRPEGSVKNKKTVREIKQREEEREQVIIRSRKISNQPDESTKSHVVAIPPSPTELRENPDIAEMELSRNLGIQAPQKEDYTRLSLPQQSALNRNAFNAYAMRGNETFFGKGCLSLDAVTVVHEEMLGSSEESYRSPNYDEFLSCFFVVTLMGCGFNKLALQKMRFGKPPNSRILDTSGFTLSCKPDDQEYNTARDLENSELYLNAEGDSVYFCYLLCNPALGYYNKPVLEPVGHTLPATRLIRIPLTPLQLTLWKDLLSLRKKVGLEPFQEGDHIFLKKDQKLLQLKNVSRRLKNLMRRSGKPISLRSVKKSYRTFSVYRKGMDSLPAYLASGEVGFDNFSQCCYSSVGEKKMSEKHRKTAMEILDDTDRNAMELSGLVPEFVIKGKHYRKKAQKTEKPDTEEIRFGSRVVLKEEVLHEYFREIQWSLEKLDPLKHGSTPSLAIKYFNGLSLFGLQICGLLFGIRPSRDIQKTLTIEPDFEYIIIADKDNRMFVEERILPIGPDLRSLLQNILSRQAYTYQKVCMKRMPKKYSVKLPLLLDPEKKALNPLESHLIKDLMDSHTHCKAYDFPSNAFRHFLRSWLLNHTGYMALVTDYIMGHSTFGREARGMFSSLPLEDLNNTVIRMQTELMDVAGITYLRKEKHNEAK